MGVSGGCVHTRARLPPLQPGRERREGGREGEGRGPHADRRPAAKARVRGRAGAPPTASSGHCPRRRHHARRPGRLRRPHGRTLGGTPGSNECGPPPPPRLGPPPPDRRSGGLPLPPPPCCPALVACPRLTRCALYVHAECGGGRGRRQWCPAPQGAARAGGRAAAASLACEAARVSLPRRCRPGRPNWRHREPAGSALRAPEARTALGSKEANPRPPPRPFCSPTLPSPFTPHSPSPCLNPSSTSSACSTPT